MVLPIDPPLRPRRGVTLKVLGICRISTVNQDPRSLEDQEALIRRYIADHYGGPADFHFIASQGSGEYLDGRELAEAEAKIEGRTFDAVVAEDLARVCRRNYAIYVCEHAEDHDTRLIAINDHIDTGRADWRMNAMFSAFKHESSNKDTSLRIRRTMRHRFTQGGIVQTTIYGYVKPRGAKTDAELSKDPAAEPVYDEMFRRLEGGETFAEVADWLNERGVRPGPYCRSPRWDVAMVGRTIRNPILMGVRVRNKKMSRRVNKTGRRRTVDAPPEELLERHCPHLAFIDQARFKRVNALLAVRNAGFRRGKGGVDPRKDVPRKRTRWPGQHLHCGVCGRLYRYGGHGQTDHLMCGGAHDYRCWNGVTADGPLAAEKLAAAVFAAVAGLPDFDEALADLTRRELERLHADRDDRRAELDRRHDTLRRQVANIRASLRDAGPSRALIEELKDLEAALDRVDDQRTELESLPRRVAAIPPLAELKARALDAFAGLAADSPEFGRLMRRLIPRIEVRPVRLCGGGRPRLRAKLALDLVALVPDAGTLTGLPPLLRRELVVDLFDPPQREAYRLPVLALKGEGLKERQIAARLGITQPAVQSAAALAREMARLGLSDPYVELSAPPDDDGKLRRHLHPRYRFRPATEPGA